MAATTFSIDTPLYIAGVVGNRGIAGNWEWWSFGIAHVVMIYVFARLWRRSEIITDAELTEIRYGGRMAAVLRGVKAFLFAVPINCIGVGYAMLAMVKVVDALELWQSLGVEPGESLKLWSVIGISGLVLLYAGFSGLWGVVATDFFQFFLALLGAIVVAIAAVSHVGGMGELINQIQTITTLEPYIIKFSQVLLDQAFPDFPYALLWDNRTTIPQELLSFTPLTWVGGLNWIRWSEAANITASTFFAYVFLQWWAFRRSDGGGEFIQRLAASKNEAEAEKAAWFFNILHYVVRTWPWILVALAAIVIYPNLEDRELGYPKLMLDFLPPAVLGLIVASLIAAFMSTVSTLINWGASYLTNDLYGRFIRPNANQTELVFIGRVASVLITGLGAIAAFLAQDVTTVFRLVIAIGTGPGLVLILRWFWWRINAAAELAAMVVGFSMGLLTSLSPDEKIIYALPEFQPLIDVLVFLQEKVLSDFGLRLLVISGVTTVTWLIVMFLTSPESDQTLDDFYRRVRPGGPGWRRQRIKSGLEPDFVPAQAIQQVLAALLLLFGAMFAIGGFLLLQPLTGWVSLILAVSGGSWLKQLSKHRDAVPMSRPGLEDPDNSPYERKQ